MKMIFNRFALLPVMCPHCHRYIWLEKYRRADVFHFWVGKYWKENICKDCIGKFDVETSQQAERLKGNEE